MPGPINQTGQSDTTQKAINLVGQFRPQIVGQALHAIKAVGRTMAPCGVNALSHRDQDIGNGYRVQAADEDIPATRATHAIDQTTASQAGKQLFEIGTRDALTAGHVEHADRPGRTMQRQIKHRGNRITALCGQTHCNES